LTIPSTAPVITSISLLELPGKHGIYAWKVYSELFEEEIFPLPYSTKEGPINTKKHLMLKDFKTIYEKINAKSYVIIPKDYVETKYSQFIYKGANLVGYSTLAEAIQKIKEILKKKEKKYIFFHYDKIDYLNHIYGPDSSYVLEGLRAIKHYLNRLMKIAKETNIIILPDHGAIRLNRKKAIKIEGLDILTEFIVGEQRALFAKPMEGMEDLVLKFFEDSLKLKKAKARIEILDKKKFKELFGSIDRVKHLEGAIFVQIEDNSYFSLYDQQFLGDHGGASREEKEIPLILL